jgi:hypothetical protein
LLLWIGDFTLVIQDLTMRRNRAQRLSQTKTGRSLAIHWICMSWGIVWRAFLPLTLQGYRSDACIDGMAGQFFSIGHLLG